MQTDYQLTQTQAQYLYITPQLKQSLKILQLGVNELNQLIEHELTENPFLEQEQTFAEASENNRQKQSMQESQLSSDLLCIADCYPINPFITNSKGNISERVVSKTMTLSENLLAQIREQEISSSLIRPVAYIIGNLHEDGYFRLSLEEIASSISCTLEDAKSSLEIVQSLEPAGIAARDLRECLLLQLDRQGLIMGLEAAILKKHADLIEAGTLYEIAESEDVSIHDVEIALDYLSSLNPFPGINTCQEKTTFVIPDILITKEGKEFIVSINDDAFLKVYLSSSYDEIYHARKLMSAGDRKFIDSNMHSASWLLNCIKQRQQTLLKISRAIVKRQHGFFDKGSVELKPLALSDIASDTGLHESTVCRAIANKFIDSPQGIISFKSLFAPGIRTIAGLVTKTCIKQTIQSLINKKGQITDQQIAEFLRGSGIKVARRTVTKYRQDLGIPSLSLRKHLYYSDQQHACL